MHKYVVPIKNINVTDENRDYTLSLLKKAKITRVLLTWVDGRENDLSLMKKNVSFFKRNGLEVGIWIGETIGHGSVLINGSAPKAAQKYQTLVSIDGNPIPNTCCPLDRNFQSEFGKKIAALASTGADMILLDDDMRLSLHGANASGVSCTCPMHMERIRKYCNEDISREDLKALAFSGKGNKYRDAWLKAQGESIYELASAFREEVDKVAPNVPLAVCSVYCHWDLDGVDAKKLTDILAGKGNRKFLRLQGAPYWSVVSDYPLIGMLEISRMFSSFANYADTEIWAEGDVYPRPRYNVPASCLELYDLGTRLDGGYDGILKYMFDYTSNPDFELGYLDLHNKNKDLIENISDIFKEGANEGVKVVCAPHMIKDFDLSFGSSFKEKSPYPYAGILLGSASIPTVYSGEGITNAAFGEYVKLLSDEDLSKGCITDAVGALLMTRSGIDVGIAEEGTFTDTNISYLITRSPKNTCAITKGQGSFLTPGLKTNVEPLLYAMIDGEEKLLAYRYENESGQRFIVYLFDANSLYKRSGIICNYAQQELLQNNIPWLSGKELPFIIEKNPDLYVLAHREKESLSLALLNCFADQVLYPKITLDREYKMVECFGCKAELEGKVLSIRSDIHANSFAAVKLIL